MAFSSSQFWLSFYMQEFLGLSPLGVAVQLLPMAIAGIIWNIVAGNVLHRINNTLLLAVGAASYIGASVLLSLMRPNSYYWAIVFPALVLYVCGADIQFNVANVRPSTEESSPLSS